jgi:hypothetical protein
VPRSDVRVAAALACGWIWVQNRNKMMVFRYDFGSAHWYARGTVLVYVHGEGSFAKAKEIIEKIFSLNSYFVRTLS